MRLPALDVIRGPDRLVPGTHERLVPVKVLIPDEWLRTGANLADNASLPAQHDREMPVADDVIGTNHTEGHSTEANAFGNVERGGSRGSLGNPVTQTLQPEEVQPGYAVVRVHQAETLGSRPVELKRHLEVFLDGAELTAERLGRKLKVLLPFAATSDLSMERARVDAWAAAKPRKITLQVSQGDSGWVMRAADAGLIKSGTSTLEAGLLGLPHVIAYRPNEFSCFIVKHLIRYQGPIGLSNLVAGSKTKPYLIPELTCSGVTAYAVAEELVKLLTDTPQLREMKSTLQKIQAVVLAGKESPSRIAAREILLVAQESRAMKGSTS